MPETAKNEQLSSKQFEDFSDVVEIIVDRMVVLSVDSVDFLVVVEEKGAFVVKSVRDFDVLVNDEEVRLSIVVLIVDEPFPDLAIQLHSVESKQKSFAHGISTKVF